jgi:hypothetical protein
METVEGGNDKNSLERNIYEFKYPSDTNLRLDAAIDAIEVHL